MIPSLVAGPRLGKVSRAASGLEIRVLLHHSTFASEYFFSIKIGIRTSPNTEESRFVVELQPGRSYI